MPRLADRVAVVTGAARGMGHAIATLFAEEGAAVIACDILEPTEDFGNERVTFRPLDVTSSEAWRELAARTRADLGPVSIVVNNAGVFSQNPVDLVEDEEWRATIGVNLDGVLYGMKYTIPQMRELGRGSIVNFASIWGVVAVPAAVAYHATKGAVVNLTRNAAITYAAENIRANSICPGIIDTPMVRATPTEITDAVVAVTPLGRQGTSLEVAYGALFLASDESSFMTGATLVIDGGYTAR